MNMGFFNIYGNCLIFCKTQSKVLISARDQSCYRTTERKYTAAILPELRNSDAMYLEQYIVRILETITFVPETLLSLNAHRIAGIASSCFPGSCSLNKSTQETFFISIYLLQTIHYRLQYKRRAPTVFIYRFYFEIEGKSDLL